MERYLWSLQLGHGESLDKNEALRKSQKNFPWETYSELRISMLNVIVELCGQPDWIYNHRGDTSVWMCVCMKVLLERFNWRERLTLSVGGTISGSTRKIKQRTELSSKTAVFQHLFLFAYSFKTHVSGYCCFCCCPFPAMVVCSLNLLAQLSFPSLWCFCQIIWRHNKNSSVLSNG